MVIKPLDMRWLIWLALAFIAVANFAAVMLTGGCYMPLLLFSAASLVMICIVLYLCRTMAASEIPMITAAFEKCVRKLEFSMPE